MLSNFTPNGEYSMTLEYPASIAQTLPCESSRRLWGKMKSSFPQERISEPWLSKTRIGSAFNPR